MSNIERKNPNVLRRTVIAVSAVIGGIAVAELANGKGAPCDPMIHVCVPGVTVPPIPPEDTVVGGPQPGEEIPVESTFAPKGPESSTTTTTTEPEVTTTTSEPEVTTTTSTTSTTTTSEVPQESSTTTVPPTVVTTAPPTVPPITVTIPPTPGETN